MWRRGRAHTAAGAEERAVTVETLTVTAKVQRSEKADLGPAFSFFPHVTWKQVW